MPLLDPLKLAKDALDKAIETEKRNRKLLDSIGPAIIDSLKPVLDEIRDAVSKIKVDVKPVVEVNPQIKIPEIRVPDVYVPDIEVPEAKVTVNVPPIKVPKVEWPEGDLPIRGWVSLMGVDLNNPLPVQLRDAKGSPITLFENLTQLISGGGGGIAKTVKVTNTVPITVGDTLTVNQLSGANWSVTGVALASGTDSVSAYQVSGATWSVSVNDAFRTTTASNLINSDDRLRVSLEGTGSGLTDTELRASAVPVSQVSGANWSVSANIGLSDTELRASSVPVGQVSGATWSVVSIANSGVDIGDVDVTSVVPGTGASNLGKAEDAVHASADVGVMALSVRNSTNTTFASADGDYQPIATDGIGRVITQPFQTRGLIATAFANPSTGVETTLLAGVAGVYFDCIMITFANQSSAIVDMDIRDATGGGIVASVTIPADSTVGWAPSVPYPQNFAADTWTIDNTGSDVSGTTVNVTGLFIRNV